MYFVYEIKMHLTVIVMRHNFFRPARKDDSDTDANAEADDDEDEKTTVTKWGAYFVIAYT